LGQRFDVGGSVLLLVEQFVKGDNREVMFHDRLRHHEATCYMNTAFQLLHCPHLCEARAKSSASSNGWYKQ
jgi:hypothetical protein